MEVLADVGCADDVLAASTPAANMCHTGWYLDVAGDDTAGRLISRMECWDGGGTDPAWVAASPCRQANLPPVSSDVKHKSKRAAITAFNAELPCARSGALGR